MNIDRCLEILDLPPGPSPEDLRRAYRDLVSVWHPDRFSGNPRLMRKAERKMKEINTAYETLTRFLSSGGRPAARPSPSPPEWEGSRRRDETEALVEAGTEKVLTACYHLYAALRRWVAGGDRDE